VKKKLTLFVLIGTKASGKRSFEKNEEGTGEGKEAGESL
jgi:hypothetical protein